MSIKKGTAIGPQWGKLNDLQKAKKLTSKKGVGKKAKDKYIKREAYYSIAGRECCMDHCVLSRKIKKGQEYRHGSSTDWIAHEQCITHALMQNAVRKNTAAIVESATPKEVTVDETVPVDTSNAAAPSVQASVIAFPTPAPAPTTQTEEVDRHVSLAKNEREELMFRRGFEAGIVHITKLLTAKFNVQISVPELEYSNAKGEKQEVRA